MLFCLGVFAWQTYVAATSLLDARSRADRVEELVRGGDFDAANRELTNLREETHRAAAATEGRLWGLATHLPFVGENVKAVRTVASVTDTVTRENSPVALRLSQAVTSGELRPRNGRIDLAAVRRLTPDVEEAAASISREQARLADLRLDKVTFPFDEVVGQLGEKVDRAESAAGSAATAFRLLPRMLGAEEERRYLLIIQNNAEIRSTGGIPGSVAVLTARKGRVSMGFQGSAADVGSTRPVKGADDSAGIFGSSLSRDFRDITFTPDFPTVARLGSAMLQQGRGIRVDGVVSVDPVALSFLLAGTGPVDVGRVTLDASNAVPVLLNQTYQVLLDPEAQNTFFEQSARALFDAVMGGKGNLRLAVTGLATGAQQHRVLLWSRRPAEQQAIRGTAVAGELPAGDGVHPHVGVYLNDATAGKPQYYLDYSAAVTATDCRSNGSQRLETTVVLRSTMPKDFDDLSVFITGNGQFAPIGTIATNLRIYGPVGGRVHQLTVDGEAVSITADRQRGRQVAVVPTALRPGDRMVVRAVLSTGADQRAEPVLSFTPGIAATPNGVHSRSACSP